jgi:hypothetical protein
MSKQLFTRWYAEQYDASTSNRVNYLECASYLEGMRDATAMELSQEALDRLERCVSALRGSANMLEVMDREEIGSPGRDSAGQS